jgi:hypothetical protein
MRGVHLLTHAVARGNLAAVRFLQRFSQFHLGTALAPFMTWQSLLEEELSYVTLEYSVVDSLVDGRGGYRHGAVIEMTHHVRGR